MSPSPTQIYLRADWPFIVRVSGDLLSVNNQTNLAIKGIIAIKAMSIMAASVSQSTDYSVRVFFVSSVQIAPSHVTSRYRPRQTRIITVGRLWRWHRTSISLHSTRTSHPGQSATTCLLINGCRRASSAKVCVSLERNERKGKVTDSRYRYSTHNPTFSSRSTSPGLRRPLPPPESAYHSTVSAPTT